MSGQLVFANPISVNSDVRRIESKTVIPRSKTYPLLSDAFRDVVTRAETENLVRRALSPVAKLVDYHLRPYSEEKIGFLGSHLCLVTVTRLPGHDALQKHSFFVKTVPYDVPGQAAYIEEKGCFKKESAFVERLMPLLMKNYKGQSWTPSCYLVKKNTLIFEDMKLRGFSNNSNKLFDLQTMRAAVTCVARFHACSLLAEEQLNGMTLKDLCPDLLQETEFKRTGRSYEWYTNAINFAIWQANDLKLDSSCIRESCDVVFDMCEPSKNKRNVVSHGDLWSSNMLFNDSGHCHLIDFQLIRYVPLAHDLMQLLYLCSTREFRRKHEQEIVEHYYSVLVKTLTDSGYSDKVPSYEELCQGVEEQRFPAAITALIFHPTVLMDGRTAANIMDNPDTYEAYYFQNRVPFVQDIMAKDTVYKAKMEENVMEVVEMALKSESLPRPT